MLKILITNCFLLFSVICFGQQQVNDIRQTATRNYKEGVLLDSIINIDDINSVTITIGNDKEKLNSKELEEFKRILKLAASAGGLVNKPGQVFLELGFKNKKQKCTIYGTHGYVNFNTCTDKWNNPFEGSFAIPQELDLDYLDQI